MKVLLIGGTGNLAQGAIKHLLTRTNEIYLIYKGNKKIRKSNQEFKIINGDRNDFDFLNKTIHEIKPDVVIDFICRNKNHAESLAKASQGIVKQIILASSVNTYGIEFPGRAILPTDMQKPVFEEAINLFEAEKVLFENSKEDKFHITIMRISNVYGYERLPPCNVSFRTVTWDRILNDKPIICCSDGLGLTHITHIEDAGLGFAFAALNNKCFQKAYHLLSPHALTWKQYLHIIADGLGKKPIILYTTKAQMEKLSEGKYDHSVKYVLGNHQFFDVNSTFRDIPEFEPNIKLKEGSSKCIMTAKEKGFLPKWDSDPNYNKIVEALQKSI